ncbi:type II toxin-antitoxin system PemK/MazF family toxin [Scytonema sp. UIC 10036]|uniref:type II toxin-antitoxin system PemK/MazF family toxin n=1 Tax=Scytonema sp. UIC 10036 TaxID=2304196 RepID=UPI00242FE738|nr:type II toxin-antitoxin system PemK/MazF family toxin [Scytonema sp. UIC 10036]
MLILSAFALPKFQHRPFMVLIQPTNDNGLGSESAGNVLQVWSVTTERFVRRLGIVSEEVMQKLLAVLIICIDYSPEATTD